MEYKEMKKHRIWQLGIDCQEFRRELGYTQNQVAQELGCSAENVSAFENGRNDNATILCWYIGKGMKIDVESRKYLFS